VGGLQFVVGDIGSLRVGFKGTLRYLLVEISGGVFGNISEIVTLHLKVKDLRFRSSGLLDQMVIQ